MTYPTRSFLEYVTEINRLYANDCESEMFQSIPSNNAPSNASISSFSQSSMARSSSSTDTSPESFPDLTSHLFHSELAEAKRHLYQRTARPRSEYDWHNSQIQPDQPFESFRTFEPNYEDMRNDAWIHPELRNLGTEYQTPTTVKRQRPIIGRNIMAKEPPMTPDEFNPNLMWQLDNLSHTPPRSFEHTFKTTHTPPRTFAQKYQQNTPPRSFDQRYTQNTPPRSFEHAQNIYELFPSEHRPYEFPSPVKSSPHVSPSLPSPKTMSLSPPPRSQFPPRMATPFKEPFVGQTNNYGQPKMCTFCKKNGETPLVYTTHTVKERNGNKHVVTCPILRSHVCGTCGATGDDAHTMTYCPVLRSGNNGLPLRSTTITLKSTRVKSNGRRRF